MLPDNLIKIFSFFYIKYKKYYRGQLRAISTCVLLHSGYIYCFNLPLYMSIAMPLCTDVENVKRFLNR